jgi:hypothetical protein
LTDKRKFLISHKMKDTYYVTSECVTSQIVPVDDNSRMNSLTDGGRLQFDVIETVFQVRSKADGEKFSPEDLDEKNFSNRPQEMTISPAGTSALPQISGNKNTNDFDLPQGMSMALDKTKASSPKTSGDDGVGAFPELKKGGQKIQMYIDRDFDTYVAITENGFQLLTKVCKEIVTCYKVISEAKGTKEEKPTIVVDRHQTEKTWTFNDQTEETLILRKEIVTYPYHLSSGDDVPPTKGRTDPAVGLRQELRTPKSATVTTDDNIAQSSDPKNLDSIEKKTKPDGAQTVVPSLDKRMQEVVIIETFDAVVELGEHPDFTENLGPKRGELPGLRHGVIDDHTKIGEKEAQEFVTIETTEAVVEVEEYQPSTLNRFGINGEPKRSATTNVELPNLKSESHHMQHTNSSQNLGSKTNEKVSNTKETLTVDIEECIIQKKQQ